MYVVYGVDPAVPIPSAALVDGPALPTTGRLTCFWNCFTAASVASSNVPFAVSSNPRSTSASCRACTSGPVAPTVSDTEASAPEAPAATSDTASVDAPKVATPSAKKTEHGPAHSARESTVRHLYNGSM